MELLTTYNLLYGQIDHFFTFNLLTNCVGPVCLNEKSVSFVSANVNLNRSTQLIFLIDPVQY
jgi:hypothetical protein